VRDEPLVRLDDRETRHALVEREFPDGRHAHAGTEHAFVDAPAPPLDELVDERALRRVVRRGNLVERNGHVAASVWGAAPAKTVLNSIGPIVPLLCR
jgi:hypothetical protein